MKDQYSWELVLDFRADNIGTLRIDELIYVEGSSLGILTELNVQGNIYIGEQF